MAAIRAVVWSPGKTQRLWPPPPGSVLKHVAKGNTFRPTISHKKYVAPPPPTPLKEKVAAAKQMMPTEELTAMAASLRSEADGMERAGPAPPPMVQLGNVILELNLNDVIHAMVAKGKGLLLRGEFRLQLRAIGLEWSSGEADELFDSWDDDKGGTLDQQELRTALLKCKKAALALRAERHDFVERAKVLREKAKVVDDAAQATRDVRKADRDLSDTIYRLEQRADVRLGDILCKRRIKPFQVVMEWSASRGAHAGELGKIEFRDKVISLGLSDMLPAEIDTLFDSFDDDKGGYMDSEEAKNMIKELLRAATDAEHERFVKRQNADAVRARANKKIAIAMEPLEKFVPSPPKPPPVELLPHEADKEKRKQDELARRQQRREREKAEMVEESSQTLQLKPKKLKMAKRPSGGESSAEGEMKEENSNKEVQLSDRLIGGLKLFFSPVGGAPSADGSEAEASAEAPGAEEDALVVVKPVAVYGGIQKKKKRKPPPPPPPPPPLANLGEATERHWAEVQEKLNGLLLEEQEAAEREAAITKALRASLPKAGASKGFRRSASIIDRNPLLDKWEALMEQPWFKDPCEALAVCLFPKG